MPDSVEARPVRLDSRDGLSLFGRYYAGSEDGQFCLCLHGLARNSRDFEEFAPQLAALGFRVLALDMRGRGDSDHASDPETYSLLHYLADCLDWLDHFGAGQAVWIGSSMGGGIAMAAGALHPARVAGIVLNDIAPEIDPRGVENIRKIAGKGGALKSWQDAADRCRVVNGHVHPDEDNEFWLRFARRTHRQTGDDSFRSDYDPAILATMGKGMSAEDRWNAFDLLREIPTLLVRGAISELVTTDIAEKMRNRRPNLGYVEVPNTGHTPLLTEKIAFNAISDWMVENGFA